MKIYAVLESCKKKDLGTTKRGILEPQCWEEAANSKHFISVLLGLSTREQVQCFQIKTVTLEMEKGVKQTQTVNET